MQNTILSGDCLDLMPNIPDKSVDMILCDLPFGMTAPEWDKIIDMNKLWDQYNRIIKKNGIIALFASQPFTSMIINSNLKDFRYCWYWLKNQGTNFYHAKHMPIRKIEEICIFKKGNYFPQISDGHIPTNSATGRSNGKAYFGINSRNYAGGDTKRFPTNVLEFKCVNNYKRLHSSEKPIDLLEYLIKTYTVDGDLILDNCAGSGSTGEACIKQNRSYILIEKDPNYVEIIKNRLKNVINDNEYF